MNHFAGQQVWVKSQLEAHLHQIGQEIQKTASRFLVPLSRHLWRRDSTSRTTEREAGMATTTLWHMLSASCSVNLSSQLFSKLLIFWPRHKLRRLVAGFPPRRPEFKLGSGHVKFCDGQKWRWGRFSPRTSVSPVNLHSICFSTIIFTITRGWHNRPGVAAVPIASQIKKLIFSFLYRIISLIN
jgi:hypothetical protein